MYVARNNEWSLSRGTHFRMIKPLFTTNPESPWQLVWNAIVNFWGNDPYKLFVFGKHYFFKAFLINPIIRWRYFYQGTKMNVLFYSRNCIRNCHTQSCRWRALCSFGLLSSSPISDEVQNSKWKECSTGHQKAHEGIDL